MNIELFKRKADLRELIDKALDNNDKDTFIKLSKEYKDLEIQSLEEGGEKILLSYFKQKEYNTINFKINDLVQVNSNENIFDGIVTGIHISQRGTVYEVLCKVNIYGGQGQLIVRQDQIGYFNQEDMTLKS